MNVASVKAWLTLVAAAGTAVIPAAALAQEAPQDALAGRHKNYQSPQHFALEVRFSPFTPEIDSDPALHGTAPYATAYGTHTRLLLGAELDWQAG